MNWSAFYSFSQQLLTSDNVLQLLNAVPQHVIESFLVSPRLPSMFWTRETSMAFLGIETPEAWTPAGWVHHGARRGHN